MVDARWLIVHLNACSHSKTVEAYKLGQGKMVEAICGGHDRCAAVAVCSSGGGSSKMAGREASLERRGRPWTRHSVFGQAPLAHAVAHDPALCKSQIWSHGAVRGISSRCLGKRQQPVSCPIAVQTTGNESGAKEPSMDSTSGTLDKRHQLMDATFSCQTNDTNPCHATWQCKP